MSWLHSQVAQNPHDLYVESGIEKWSYLEDAKIIISAAGSEDLSNETDTLADENRRITIEFKRK